MYIIKYAPHATLKNESLIAEIFNEIGTMDGHNHSFMTFFFEKLHFTFTLKFRISHK